MHPPTERHLSSYSEISMEERGYNDNKNIACQVNKIETFLENNDISSC